MSPPTGAGWGGCTVSLVQEEHVPAFLAELRDKYYGPLLASGRATDESMSETLFATRPSAGAAIMRLKLAPPEVEQEPAKEAVAA
jgi:N-acetylgalactosamine kinase